METTPTTPTEIRQTVAEFYNAGMTLSGACDCAAQELGLSYETVYATCTTTKN